MAKRVFKDSWIPLLGTMSDKVLAKKLGVSISPIWSHRVSRKIPSFSGNTRWRPEWDKLLGKYTDFDVAEKTGMTWHSVRKHRDSLGIPPLTLKQVKREKANERIALLTDDDLRGCLLSLSRRLHVPINLLVNEREKRGITSRRFDKSLLVRAAISGMLSVSPNVTLTQVGEVVGLTRERVRQVSEELKASLSSVK